MCYNFIIKFVDKDDNIQYTTLSRKQLYDMANLELDIDFNIAIKNLLVVLNMKKIEVIK